MINTTLLKEKRLQLNMSISEVAGKIGITEKAYEDFENGVCEPSPRIVLLLSYTLGIEVEDVMISVEKRKEVERDSSFDGKKLWDERKARNMSRRELSDIVGVNKKTIDNWEHGLMCPRTEYRRCLEAVFAVPIGYFDKE